MKKFSKFKFFCFITFITTALFFVNSNLIHAQEISYSTLIIDHPYPQARAYFGWGVARGEDFNGDGITDLLLGASGQTVDGYVDRGQVFVLSGADATLLLAIKNPALQTHTLFGEWITAVDDINQDGVPDILIGAQSQDVEGNYNQGQAFIFSGADGSLLRTIDNPNPQPRTWFGWGVCRLEDVNDDGIGDYVVAAGGQEVDGNNYQGQVFVFSGKDGNLLYTIDNPNPQPGAYFGEWADVVGDINGDNVSDLIVGADGQTVNGNISQGQAFVFSGKDGSLLLTLDNPNPQQGGYFGFPVEGAGDVSWDGVPDLLVGAYGNDVAGNYNQGQAFLFSGADGSLLLTIDNPNPELGYSSFGWSLVGAGDINNDEVPDLLVSAASQTVGGNSYQGRCYLFSGVDGSLLATLDNPNPQARAWFGEGVANVGDVNMDGVSDLLIGAGGHTVGGNQHQGQAFLFLSIVSPEEQIELIIDKLRDLIETDPAAEAELNGIIDELNKAQMEFEKIPPDYLAADGCIEGAVGKIEDAVKDGFLDSDEGIRLMNQLALVARQLAVDAIEEAIALGGDQQIIDDAQYFLEIGDDLRAAGAFKDAVNEYKQALDKAKDALG